MKPNYYGFKHDVVNEKFGGELTYVGDFMVDENLWAVYKAAKPDRSKGHKDYMMLCYTHVSGMDEERMQKNRYHHGVLCLNCGELLFSYHRHDYKTCGCENHTMVDGGGAYMRSGGADMGKVQVVKFDCLTQTMVDAN